MAQRGRSQGRTTKRKQPERSASASSSESEGLLQPIKIRDEDDAATSSGGESDTDGSDMQEGGAAAGLPTANGSTQQPPQEMRDERSQHNAAAQPDAPTRSAPMLPWMRVPIAVGGGASVPLAEVKGVQPQLSNALEAAGFSQLFPVQAAVWRQLAGGHSQAHDLCINAPTGFGKTLAYALPVLSALIGRQSPAVRALAVLPTRDLALQVFQVFALLCPSAGLRTVLVAGKASQAVEASALVGNLDDDSEAEVDSCSRGGGADIVVATPGRLVAHLQGTPGFHLADLQFLIVDEADRLLRQAYQDWLPKVLAAVAPAPDSAADAGWRQRVIKVVASATLTRDPSKLERLALHCPRYIAVSATDHRYQLPRQLREHKMLCKDAQKPLALLTLLARRLAGQQTLVFAASVETVHRVSTFLSATEALAGRCVEFSSLVSPAVRAAHLAAFRAGTVQVLVCSDAMTRGMDVENAANVVSYDAPVYAKTYVHRCGRTARAGKAGCAITLVRKEDMRHFKAMLRKVDNTFVKDLALKPEDIEALQSDYEKAIAHAQAASGMHAHA